MQGIIRGIDLDGSDRVCQVLAGRCEQAGYSGQRASSYDWWERRAVTWETMTWETMTCETMP